jgi:crotonobetainyl-CoA hydratase
VTDATTKTEQPAALAERRGNVMVITLNRPEARNACNQALWLAAGEALEEAEQDAQIRVVIITGAGDQSFCAGADLKAMSRGEAIVPEDPVKAGWGFAGIVSHYISKPVIGAVNGIALGGGTELALSCDLLVAAEEASFGLPEVKRGLIAGAGGVFRLPRQIPRKLAMEFMLTGEPFTAQRALELGFVNRVVPRAQLMSAALELAEKIAANAPLAVQASKRIALGIDSGKMPSEDVDWQATQKEGRRIGQSEDAREGPLAFAQKRTPVWKAR